MAFAVHFLVVLLCADGAIPSLSDGQRERLSRAVDGTDHREDAFLALVEHARAWNVDRATQAAAPVVPDALTLLRQPARVRGELFLVQGALEQRSPLAPPYEDVQEWFVRDQHGVPVVVYLCGITREITAPPRALVTIRARFYKRIDFIARDGEQRAYPAFVGAAPAFNSRAPAIAATSPGVRNLWMIAGPVAALLIVFVFLRLSVGRRGSRLARPIGARRDISVAPADIENVELPTDAADALTELKRRAHDNR